ncbi:hypothetical protein SAMN05428953_1452 [Mesorhizobium muleiense]|uniref:Uncharacterized protein n=1 Tax=Mesorhizobium muleiense TaxID=1004279 RepID=A0A1G9L0M7_9HYPH|nr:hypothetical protein SAMN05428953_1452 [Mesorhizobium muleiense]
MRSRMFATAVARIVEQRGGRIGAAEWPIVADIDPQPADIGLALRKDLDPAIEGHERESGRANLVGERRQAQWHALARETLSLAVQWLMLTGFVETAAGRASQDLPGHATRHGTAPAAG